MNAPAKARAAFVEPQDGPRLEDRRRVAERPEMVGWVLEQVRRGLAEERIRQPSTLARAGGRGLTCGCVAAAKAGLTMSSTASVRSGSGRACVRSPFSSRRSSRTRALEKAESGVCAGGEEDARLAA